MRKEMFTMYATNRLYFKGTLSIEGDDIFLSNTDVIVNMTAYIHKKCFNKDIHYCCSFYSNGVKCNSYLRYGFYNNVKSELVSFLHSNMDKVVSLMISFN